MCQTPSIFFKIQIRDGPTSANQDSMVFKNLCSGLIDQRSLRALIGQYCHLMFIHTESPKASFYDTACG